eukprot:1310024-Alexandrium_andersonii.AAC.1
MSPATASADIRFSSCAVLRVAFNGCCAYLLGFETRLWCLLSYLLPLAVLVLVASLSPIFVLMPLPCAAALRT